jgi:ABC-type microcin C transport system duplicated ATPase subunit YejF
MGMSPPSQPVVSRLDSGVAQPDDGNLLEVRDLAKLFPITQGFFKKVVGHVRAVDGVSFTIPRG